MSEVLAAKSVLIVAKKLEELSQLRTIFAGLGSTDISVASSANMAVSMLRMRPFELVVIDYGLGQHEKNGLQVIEEATREGLRLCTHAYLLIVDDSIKQPPRDSISFGPDTFLNKPIDTNKVASRVDKLMRLKQAVRPIENLIDQEDYDKALQLIPKLVARYASLELYLDRLKGRILLDQERFADAVEHFSLLARQRNIEWAHLGNGIAQYHQGNYVEALRAFEQVLEKNPRSLEAYEWLAQVYRSAGRNREAQVLLSKAAEVLPTAPSIFSGLGNVASENCNWDVATDAFRNAVRYAKHSCHQSQDNYFGLARCLQTRLSPTGSPNSYQAMDEAVRILENVVEEYFDNDHIRFRSRLMTAETYKHSGDNTRANAAAKDAFEVFKTLDDQYKAEELDNLLEGLEGTDVHGAAESYKSEFNKKIYTETDWGRLNMQGMSYYRKGQYSEAFEHFKHALELVESSPSILLNLVQSGHELIKLYPEQAADVLAVCNKYLLQMSIGALNTKQQQRYRALSERRAQLLDGLEDN